MIKAWMMKILSSLFTFYSSAYPPEQSGTYVKATTEYAAGYNAIIATNPLNIVTGALYGQGWFSANGSPSNQRFHIDLGIATIIARIYYENAHDSGGVTNSGAKNFTFWGSNNSGAFADLTYGDDTNWTQIGGSFQFDQHTAADVIDPKFIVVPGTVAYRYYAIKIADNWGYAPAMGFRRIELQASSQYKSQYPPALSATWVKATSTYTTYYPYSATNPAQPLAGGVDPTNSWLTTPVQNRFHIDLGFPQVINRIYYENYHHAGGQLTRGSKTFTLWGSNTAGDFANVTYANDGTWVNLSSGLSQNTFDEHAAVDFSDPKFIMVRNTVAYRYYCIKISDNWGDAYTGLRRIELQTDKPFFFPPLHNDVYVKATTHYDGRYQAWDATNPILPVIGNGDGSNNFWYTSSVTNQRFHIDLGFAQVINRIYYENGHTSGAQTDLGAKNFTLWGSNTPASFAELTYGTDTGWTQLTTDISQLVQHTGSDVPDPKFITVTNTNAYRYYAFKFADNWGSVSAMAVRRIQLQCTQ